MDRTLRKLRRRYQDSNQKCDLIDYLSTLRRSGFYLGVRNLQLLGNLGIEEVVVGLLGGPNIPQGTYQEYVFTYKRLGDWGVFPSKKRREMIPRWVAYPRWWLLRALPRRIARTGLKVAEMAAECVNFPPIKMGDIPRDRREEILIDIVNERSRLVGDKQLLEELKEGYLNRLVLGPTGGK